MTIKELIEELSKQGYEVRSHRRSDGGYIISKINGMSFKGAKGNAFARKIVGAELSHARAYQLERIRPPKKVAPMKRKLTPIPQDLLKEVRKIQREWRKQHKDVGGIISVRGVRYQLEHNGEESVRASLNKAYRYAQGYAYLENVRWLIEKWTMLTSKVDSNDVAWINKIISVIESKILTFKEEWIHKCYYEAYYPYIQGQISVAEAYFQTFNITR